MQVTLSTLGTKYKQFNINDKVLIKLTDKGREILHHNHDELNQLIIERGGLPLDPLVIKEDENGYYSMQMWEFIQTFGQYLSLACKLPFETTILFQTNTLKRYIL